MKTGDLVRVTALPANLPDNAETREVFARCLGKTFPIADVRDDGQAELEVGAVTGVKAVMHSIWVEPDCIELVRPVRS
jgi:hypothetical protein